MTGEIKISAVIFILCLTLIQGREFGDSCRANLDCPSDKYLYCRGASISSRGKCFCLPGMVWDGEQCLSTPSTSCLKNPSCAADSSCINGVCECDAGFIMSYSPYPLPRRTCFASFNTVCYFENVTSTCDSLRGLRCSTTGEIIERCECEDFKVWSPTRQKCVHVVGSNCLRKDDSCTENAVCSNNRCMCQEGYTPTKDMICLGTVGTPCNSSAQHLGCNKESGLVCSSAGIKINSNDLPLPVVNTWSMISIGNNEIKRNASEIGEKPKSPTCQCPDSRMRFQSGSCRWEVGTHCGPDTRCVKNAYCSQLGVCTCDERKSVEGEGKICKELGGFDGPCHFDSDCPWFNLVCVKGETEKYGKCSCPQGKVWDKNNQICRVHVGENCNLDLNCVEGAECVRGTCQCSRRFELKDKKCVKNSSEKKKMTIFSILERK